MKFASKIVLALAMSVSASAFAADSSEWKACAEKPATEVSFLQAEKMFRPDPAQCYLECKPTSGGGDGDDFTSCFNECMRRP
jgi:hypothetical protein